MPTIRYLSPLRGIFSFFFYIVSLLINAFLLVLTFLFEKLFPFKKEKGITRFLYDHLPLLWVSMNRFIFTHISRNRLECVLPADLKRDVSYVMTANHQSWADILILYQVFSGHIPMLKFFMKSQLKWVPLVGQVTRIYGFPFLHRYTQAELKRHPEWRNRDNQAMRLACERFKQQPGSMTIFAEGTRFTETKRQQQQSPYHYLLKPKSGGLGLVMQYMSDHIDTLIDVTIVYPSGRQSFWQYCCGTADTIKVYAKSIPLVKTADEKEARRYLQPFLNTLWSEKDHFIGNCHEKSE